MKYFLILLFISTTIFAQSKESCHSLQIKSFSKTQSFNFVEQDYPDSCAYFSFKYSNAIRCGCYETKSIAKKESKKLRKKYSKSIITTTYKYRFDTLKKKKESVKKVEIKKQVPLKIVAVPKTIETTKPVPKVKVKVKVKTVPVVKQEKSIEMRVKKVGFIDSIVQKATFVDDITIQGKVELTGQYYRLRPEGKHPVNLTASAVLEIGYEKDNLQIKSKLKAQQDYYDFQSKPNNTDRSYLRFDELYGTYDLENDQIAFGKNVRFWGALEVRNITNSFNSDELRDDPFESDKLGSWNAAFTHYTDSGELSAIVKFYEQSRAMSAFPYVYYYFPQNITIAPDTQVPLSYRDTLHTEKSEFRPSLYLNYSGSTDSEYPLDYAIIFENGYDSQRYYTTTMAADAATVQTNENAYLVNKLSSYNTLVLGSTLVKLEAVYTDVISDEQISDYLHIGLGLEHTLNQFYGDTNLGLIAEYYYYDIFDDSKRSDLELFELFQNDLFLGLRYSFNDENDANIIGGAILDMDYDEQVYYLEYETRIADMFKLNFDYRFVQPSSEYKTAFNLMGKHERISLKMGYHF